MKSNAALADVVKFGLQQQVVQTLYSETEVGMGKGEQIRARIKFSPISASFRDSFWTTFMFNKFIVIEY